MLEASRVSVSPAVLTTQMNRTKYLILGAGAAGLYLARQLASMQAGEIVLAEAGGFAYDVRATVPVYYPKLFGSRFDWRYNTLPQTLLSNRRILWPRGKAVGGSTVMNAMIYLQAAEADFQRWGWTWASGLSRQLRIESEDNLSPHPWSSAFVQACSEMGLTILDPMLQSHPKSCGIFQRSTRNGRRSQALWQSIDSSIRLLTNTLVSRLLIKGSEAIGAELIDGSSGQSQILSAEHIILAAGAIGSPELLLRSGIGEPNELAEAGVDCVHELDEVGRNLQDHLVMPLVYRSHSPGGLPRRHDRNARNAFRKASVGTMASNIAEAGAVVQCCAPEPDDSQRASGIQIHFTPTHYLKYPFTATDDRFLSLAITDLHPASRGFIRLVRESSNLSITIDPKYLSAECDVARIIDGMRWGRKLAQSNSLSSLIESEVFPGDARDTDEQLTRSIRMFAQSIYHPVGTCRMQSDETVAGTSEYVVEQDFRVRGLDRLYVVDASVLPDLPSANTAAVTYLLAHRAAELFVTRN